MKQRFLILALTAATLMGCSEKVVREVIDLNAYELETLKTESTTPIYSLMSPAQMKIVGDHLVVVSSSMGGFSDKNVVHLFDKSTLEYQGGNLFYGRGKDEFHFVNPFYFYALSDSTFTLHTNESYETKCVIRNSKVEVLSTELVIDEIPGNLYRVDDKVRLTTASERPGNDTTEYLLVEKTGEKSFTRKGVGSYPELGGSDFKPFERENVYSKAIITANDGVVSIYGQVPLIRKYDKDFNLVKEYIFADEQDFRVSSYENFIQQGYSFSSVIANYGDLVCFGYKIGDKNEFVIMNTDCEILKRFNIEVDLNTLYCAAMDNSILYLMSVSEDGEFSINKLAID